MKMTATGKADLYRDVDFKKNEIEMIKERKETDIIKDKKIEKKHEVEKSENKKQEKIDEKELDKILEKLNLDSNFNKNSIRFEKNYDYDRIVVQVINKDTGELIKQLPPEHVLEFNRLYQEFTGMLFDITV
jgi:flagellar protein FlaG